MAQKKLIQDQPKFGDLSQYNFKDTDSAPYNYEDSTGLPKENDKFQNKDLYTTIHESKINKAIIERNLKTSGKNFIRIDELYVSRTDDRKSKNNKVEAYLFSEKLLIDNGQPAGLEGMGYSAIKSFVNNSSISQQRFFSQNFSDRDSDIGNVSDLEGNDILKNLSPSETDNNPQFGDFNNSDSGFGGGAAANFTGSLPINEASENIPNLNTLVIDENFSNPLYFCFRLRGDKDPWVGTDVRKKRYQVYRIDNLELFNIQGNIVDGKQTEFTLDNLEKVSDVSGDGGGAGVESPAHNITRLKITISTYQSAPNNFTDIDDYEDIIPSVTSPYTFQRLNLVDVDLLGINHSRQLSNTDSSGVDKTDIFPDYFPITYFSILNQDGDIETDIDLQSYYEDDIQKATRASAPATIGLNYLISTIDGQNQLAMENYFFVINWNDKDNKIKSFEDWEDVRPTSLEELKSLQENDLYVPAYTETDSGLRNLELTLSRDEPTALNSDGTSGVVNVDDLLVGGFVNQAGEDLVLTDNGWQGDSSPAPANSIFSTDNATINYIKQRIEFLFGPNSEHGLMNLSFEGFTESFSFINDFKFRIIYSGQLIPPLDENVANNTVWLPWGPSIEISQGMVQNPEWNEFTWGPSLMKLNFTHQEDVQISQAPEMQTHTYTTPGIKTIKSIMVSYNNATNQLGRWKLLTSRIFLDIPINQYPDFSELGGDDYTTIPWPYTTPVIGGVSEDSKYKTSIQDTLSSGNIGDMDIIDEKFLVNDRDNDELGKSIKRMDLEQCRYFDKSYDISQLLNISYTPYSSFQRPLNSVEYYIENVNEFPFYFQEFDFNGDGEINATFDLTGWANAGRNDISSFLNNIINNNLINTIPTYGILNITPEYLATLPFPQYVEELNISGGNLDTSDVSQWEQSGRPDIAHLVNVFRNAGGSGLGSEYTYPSYVSEWGESIYDSLIPYGNGSEQPAEIFFNPTNLTFVKYNNFDYYDGDMHKFPMESSVGQIFISDNQDLDLKQSCKLELNTGELSGKSIYDSSGNSNKGILIGDYKVKKVRKGEPMRRDSFIKVPKKTGNSEGAL